MHVRALLAACALGETGTGRVPEPSGPGPRFGSVKPAIRRRSPLPVHGNAAGELRSASSIARTSTLSTLSSLSRLVDDMFPTLRAPTAANPNAGPEVGAGPACVGVGMPCRWGSYFASEGGGGAHLPQPLASGGCGPCPAAGWHGPCWQGCVC